MLESVKQSKNTFFINLRDEEQILNETNDLIFGLIKEDIVNNYKNPEEKDFTELHELMRNKMALHIFFKKNILWARRSFWASLLYLPVLLFMMNYDKIS